MNNDMMIKLTMDLVTGCRIVCDFNSDVIIMDGCNLIDFVEDNFDGVYGFYATLDDIKEITDMGYYIGVEM